MCEMQKLGPKPKQPRSKTPRHPAPSRRERQTVRILALLRVLAQGGKPSVHELAAEFRTRRETIYRDLRVLQDAGYPITGDEHGRLSRPRLLPTVVPEIRFSAQEVAALLVAAAQVDAALPTADSLSSAALKLKALGRSEQVPIALELEEAFETWTCGSKDHRQHEERVAVLIEAILCRMRCRVQYQKPSGSEPKIYAFDPYKLLSVGGGLYVVGYVPKHRSTVTLAVNRLLSVILSNTEFEVDPAFDVQKCRENAFGVSWQDPQEITLRLRADQAPYVRERLWHPTQKFVGLPDGQLELSFRAGGPFEIRRWILGWGDAVEVVSPVELRREIEGVLSSASTLYTT